jgi:hypothetical protein
VENGPDRAAFWADFILTRCEYPAPALLREQLARATFAEFCPCGCNSFGVQNSEGARPLMPPRDEVLSGRHGAIFEVEFRLANSNSIEIILFANDEGNLDYIEVDCNANSEPVPQEIVALGRPLHGHTSDSLYMDL